MQPNTSNKSTLATCEEVRDPQKCGWFNLILLCRGKKTRLNILGGGASSTHGVAVWGRCNRHTGPKLQFTLIVVVALDVSASVVFVVLMFPATTPQRDMIPFTLISSVKVTLAGLSSLTSESIS